MTDPINHNENTSFPCGKQAYKTAARIAAACECFSEDSEEELVCDDEKSCYNCRYRRWTQTSFVCMKGYNL